MAGGLYALLIVGSLLAVAAGVIALLKSEGRVGSGTFRGTSIGGIFGGVALVILAGIFFAKGGSWGYATLALLIGVSFIALGSVMVADRNNKGDLQAIAGAMLGLAGVMIIGIIWIGVSVYRQTHGMSVPIEMPSPLVEDYTSDTRPPPGYSGSG